ncbi:hypothetical protein A3F02_02620 [Candidatus Curtissbacteria bacterium RIFCSPHIGHO2_12_FULL_38_9b]|uniref:General secretion pathway GspH domain-containing protein n=2 Tax=Candidatus Curtissiibacteriota TaxID=1752717 RepID=A0A1F5GY09_9BACT|nr:MAG: hypothetical protein A3A48_01105 [Candidatus Curtissbacteria bacterium RIFCSPLOWO2_01_FULL_37_9]OGD96763.1 MAG: hypothetical protein A3F02_02620 [Candidatus Curtissbacteria bacterium RIFCSPHIGHO2_12_FULL_38_9b]
MPRVLRTVSYKHLTFNKLKEFVKCNLLHVTCQCEFTLRRKLINVRLPGFTLIELLIVISIFGLTTSLITASYVSFERNQRLKNAAQTITSEIRLAQNRALSGDKIDGKCQTSISASSLIGWYVSFVKDSDTYTIAGDCIDATQPPWTEIIIGEKIVALPKGIIISGINVGLGTSASILFRPLTNVPSLHDGQSIPPNFLDDGGLIIDPRYTGALIIEISSHGGSTYQVIMSSTGEVSEKKL